MTGSRVWKIACEPSITARQSCWNSGPRWSMTGMLMARKTRSGTGLGPGICRKWRPWGVLMDSSRDPKFENDGHVLHSFFASATCPVFSCDKASLDNCVRLSYLGS